MKNIRVSATEARNNFFELLNQVIYEDARVVIEKAGSKKNVELVVSETATSTKNKRLELIKETYGLFKTVSLSEFTDDRVRGKRAKEYLEKVRAGHA